MPQDLAPIFTGLVAVKQGFWQQGLAAMSVTAVLEFTRQRGEVRCYAVLGGGYPGVDAEAVAEETVMTPMVPGPVCTPSTGPRVPVTSEASGAKPRRRPDT